MKVLQTCGILDATLTTADVKVMLPDLKNGGSYAFHDFYNLSVSNGTEKFYVILGVIKVSNESVGKLNEYRTDKIDLKEITGHKFDYVADVLDPLEVGLNLDEVTNSTDLYVITLHEDNFNLEEGGKSTLSTIRTNILTNIEDGDFASMIIPKDGNGGLLKTGGCTF